MKQSYWIPSPEVIRHLKYAYQALLIEEFGRAGTTVMFVKGPRSDSPEDALLVQFQGMIAEYERAQILERTRRGKTHRAKAGTVNVLSGAPFGYRYVRKSDHADACYEIVPHEAAIVAELFARYADGGVAIAELTRWLGGLGVASRTGKTRWDRSVLWGMLRNPACAGRACSARPCAPSSRPGSTACAAGRAQHAAALHRGRPAPRRLAGDPRPRTGRRGHLASGPATAEDNKRYASRNSTNPSLLQGICVCASCGYAYYRTSTRTTTKIIYYYRCLGSDDYRYEHGRVCANKPVRADYLDGVVWDHISDLLADPALIRTEITKRLAQVRTADPATVQRRRLHAGLAKAREAITRLIGAYQEQLISLDELRSRMPELRTRETSLRQQTDALDAQLADRAVYLKLADNLEGLPRQPAQQGRCRDRRRTPTRPATPRQRRPCRPRQDHHPPLHPGPPQPTATQPRAAPTPTRRVKLGLIANCVGGVISPLLANIYLTGSTGLGMSGGTGC